MGLEPLPERVPRAGIVVLDEAVAAPDSLRLVLERELDVVDVRGAAHALEVLGRTPVDIAVIDVPSGTDAVAVLADVKRLDDRVGVILVADSASVRTAVALMRHGACDYLGKPYDAGDLLAAIRRAAEQRVPQRVACDPNLGEGDGLDRLIGRHPDMQALFKTMTQAAAGHSTVLVAGESGTGKELVARAIHRMSARRDGPFVAVNPAAIADSLAESELFGHERGAFTGAFQRKPGRFELAQGGTLFLDEIASLKPELQAKLLRVLQERELERVGGTRTIRLDVRIIAATNIDLRQAVEHERFRADLFYRLNVVQIVVPPLRDRREDIPLLVQHFIERYNRELGKRIPGASADVLAALQDYPWPGNVRELQNAVERAMALAESGPLGLADLPMDVLLPDHRARVRSADAIDLRSATDEFARQIVLRVLERVRWNRSEAARALGIHRNSLQVKLHRWHVTVPGREA